MTGPADREFAVLPRGYVRDRVVLMNWRMGLRNLTNPETGSPFTEDEISRATQVGSRWWIEAEGIDQMGQLTQRNAIYLSDQGRLERASSEFLLNYHGRQWGESKLPATGASGDVTILAVAGTLVVGSTTVPDDSAYQARDAAGKKYQVFVGGVVPSSGSLVCTIKAMDTGKTTNLVAGDTLTWISRDPNMKPTCVVASDFSGGTDVETDAEFAARMAGNIQHKQAAGNDAHFRKWARGFSNSVEDAYIYPCALNAGSVVIALTAKRTGEGPTQRIPSSALISSATAYLVPPASAVVPARAFVLVVPTVSVDADLGFQLALEKGSSAGWEDVRPFPNNSATLATVQTVTSLTEFTMTCADSALPGQSALATLTAPDAPSLMIWCEAKSKFERLNVQSVEDLGSHAFRVILSSKPKDTVIVYGDVVSPYMARHSIVTASIGTYFDELGPGDLFDVSTDPRGGRCVRFPRYAERRPCKIGQAIATRIIDDMGGSSADALVSYMPTTSPGYPASVSDGPRMLVPGKIGVYPL